MERVILHRIITAVCNKIDSNPLFKKVKLSCIASGSGAFVITLVLFVIMPMLHAFERPRISKSPATFVNIINLPRPDTHENLKTPELPVLKPKKLKLETRASDLRSNNSLSLPFDISVGLADGLFVMEMPPLAQVNDFNFNTRKIFSSGDLDHPLTTLVRVPPEYPLNARQKKIQGFVMVRFVVNTEGKVENVMVIKAQPEGIFDKSVIRCVARWRFEPGTVKGTPVNTWAETTINFELEREG